MSITWEYKELILVGFCVMTLFFATKMTIPNAVSCFTEPDGKHRTLSKAIEYTIWSVALLAMAIIFLVKVTLMLVND